MANNITVKRKQELKEIQNELNQLSNSIQNIIDGKSSMSEFARSLNITPQKLNQDIHGGVYALLKRTKTLTTSDIEQLIRDSESASERLLRVILGTNELFILSIAEDEKLIKIIHEALTEREIAIIEYRFGFNGHPMTLEETSKVFNVTTARIRQIEARALRRLRHPKWLKMLLPDYDLKVKELLELETMANFNNNFNSQIEYHKEQIEKHNPFNNTPIDELNLSVRSYNCLSRWGKINTIGELSSYTVRDLMKIRGCGKHSVKEIIDAAAKFGVVILDAEGLFE